MATSQAPQKHILSIGTLLVAARNHTALNQSEVASQTKLPLRTIQALENDEFEKLPEYTYVRGYLRLYAQVVGIDEKDVIEAYDEQYHVAPKVSPVVGSKDGFNPVTLWGTVAVAALLAGLLVILWAGEKFMNQDSNLTSVNSSFTPPNLEDDKVVTSLSTSTSSGDVVATDDPVVQKADDQVLPVMENQSPASEEQTSLPEREENIGMDTEQVEQEQPVQVGRDQSLTSDAVITGEGVDVLMLKYTGESWTEISDADSSLLMRELSRAGSVRSFRGKAPFHIFLGNSPSVVIEINGQYFDHSKFKQDNRTAKFQVPSDLSN